MRYAAHASARGGVGRLRPAQTVIDEDGDDGVGTSAGFGYDGRDARTIVRRRYSLGRLTYLNLYNNAMRRIKELEAQLAAR